MRRLTPCPGCVVMLHLLLQWIYECSVFVFIVYMVVISRLCMKGCQTLHVLLRNLVNNTAHYKMVYDSLYTSSWNKIGVLPCKWVSVFGTSLLAPFNNEPEACILCQFIWSCLCCRIQLIKAICAQHFSSWNRILQQCGNACIICMTWLYATKSWIVWVVNRESDFSFFVTAY